MKSGFESYLRKFVALLFAVSGVVSFCYRDFVYVFVSFVMLILVVYPKKFERKRGVSFSSGLNLVILLFIYAAIGLGEFHDFYLKLWWWDIMLHSFSAATLGLLGFSVVYFLNDKVKDSNLSALLVAIFGFSFAVMIGALWEIFEFSMDYFLGMNMQKSGVIDTMTDLIVNTSAAFIVSCWGYLSLKGDFNKSFDFFKGLIVRK